MVRALVHIVPWCLMSIDRASTSPRRLFFHDPTLDTASSLAHTDASTIAIYRHWICKLWSLISWLIVAWCLMCRYIIDITSYHLELQMLRTRTQVSHDPTTAAIHSDLATLTRSRSAAFVASVAWILAASLHMSCTSSWRCIKIVLMSDVNSAFDVSDASTSWYRDLCIWIWILYPTERMCL